MKNICPNCLLDMDYHNSTDEKNCQLQLSKKLMRLNHTTLTDNSANLRLGGGD